MPGHLSSKTLAGGSQHAALSLKGLPSSLLADQGCALILNNTRGGCGVIDAKELSFKEQWAALGVQNSPDGEGPLGPILSPLVRTPHPTPEGLSESFRGAGFSLPFVNPLGFLGKDWLPVSSLWGMMAANGGGGGGGAADRFLQRACFSLLSPDGRSALWLLEALVRAGSGHRLESALRSLLACVPLI